MAFLGEALFQFGVRVPPRLPAFSEHWAEGMVIARVHMACPRFLVLP